MTLLKTNRIVILTYGLPILVVLFSIALALSPILKQYPELATAITYDLVLTAPILFLLLSLRTNTPKIRAIPFFVGGIAIANILLPESGQEHLSYIKTYLLPLIEIVVLIVISLKIYKGLKTFRINSNVSSDFQIISRKSVIELFGESRYTSFLASEITMLYYAFFSWKPKKLIGTEFSNYKENASIAIAGAFLMIVCIETYAFHVILIKWSSITAWFLTGLSIYSAMGIIAHIKALLNRPSELTNEKLVIKNGLIADISIPLTEIDKIEKFSGELNSKELKIGNLGLGKESSNHNIAIHFNKGLTIQKIYGFTEECDILLIHMDEKNRFLNAVNTNLNKLSI